MSAPAPPTAVDREKQWWQRTLAIFRSPSPVFAALGDDSDEDAGARQEPLLALVLLAGIAAVLAWSPTTGRLLDGSEADGVVVAVVIFIAGSLYGTAAYWVGGAAIYLGTRGAGSAGGYRRARHVVGFAAAPLALSLVVVWPLRLALFGGDAFRAGGADGRSVASALFTALELAFVVWALALLVLGIRAVQGWTVVRSLGAVALAALAFLAFTIPFVLPLAAR